MFGCIVEKETSDTRIWANETESWMAYTCIMPWVKESQNLSIWIVFACVNKSWPLHA